MDRLDQIVTWAEDSGLYIVINYHRPLNKDDTEMAKIEVNRIWTQVASRFAGRSNYILYELAMSLTSGVILQ